MMMILPILFGCVVVLLTLGSSTAQTNGTTTSIEELAQLYEDYLLSYSAFPPVDPDNSAFENNLTRPVQVVLTSNFISVDAIEPGNSRFTVSARHMMYWKKADCNQSEAHELACSQILHDGKGSHFLKGSGVVGDPRTELRLDLTDAHSAMFDAQGNSDLQADGQLTENQVTYEQSFVMTYYPYEYHELQIFLHSFYSSNIVELAVFPSVHPGILNPQVPPGWALRGVACEIGIGDGGRVIGEYSEDAITFPYYSCTIKVSRRNPGWWLTSFLLFLALISIGFVGTIGVLPRLVAEARDDKDEARKALYDGTRLDGTFTVGLLLTYVFQVQISPYDRPIEYWSSIPASTIIYVLGLTAIVLQSAAGLIGSIVFTRPFLADGFRGQPMKVYELEELPQEGKNPEEDAPLLKKKYRPVPAKEASGEKVDNPPVASMQSTETESPLVEEIVGKSEDDAGQSTGDKSERGELESAVLLEDGAPGQIAHSRKKNQKEYNVLSMEEAAIINKFVSRLFYLKVFILVSVITCACVVLILAAKRHDDALYESPETVTS